MAEIIVIAAVAILLLVAFGVAAVMFGADSRVDATDAVGRRVGIS